MLYINDRIRGHVRASFLQAGSATYSASSGTAPAHTIAGLGHSLAYLNSFGMAEIEAHNAGLRERLYQGLLRLEGSLGLVVVSPPAGPLAGSICAFAMPCEPTPGWSAVLSAGCSHIAGLMLL